MSDFMLTQPKDPQYRLGVERESLPGDLADALMANESAFPNALLAEVRTHALLAFRTSPKSFAAGTFRSWNTVPAPTGGPHWHQDSVALSAASLALPDVPENVRGRRRGTCFASMDVIRTAFRDALDGHSLHGLAEKIVQKTPYAGALKKYVESGEHWDSLSHPAIDNIMSAIQAFADKEKGKWKRVGVQIRSDFYNLLRERAVSVAWTTPGQIVFWDDAVLVHTADSRKNTLSHKKLLPRADAYLMHKMSSLFPAEEADSK